MMTIVERFVKYPHKLCLGKADEHAKIFAAQVGGYSMYRPGFGLGVDHNLSQANQLWAAFRGIAELKGLILFNVNGHFHGEAAV